jgi:hypothetical protein
MSNYTSRPVALSPGRPCYVVTAARFLRPNLILVLKWLSIDSARTPCLLDARTRSVQLNQFAAAGGFRKNVAVEHFQLFKHKHERTSPYSQFLFHDRHLPGSILGAALFWIVSPFYGASPQLAGTIFLYVGITGDVNDAFSATTPLKQNLGTSGSTWRARLQDDNNSSSSVAFAVC